MTSTKLERSRGRLELLKSAYLKATTPEQRQKYRELVKAQESAVRMRERAEW